MTEHRRGFFLAHAPGSAVADGQLGSTLSPRDPGRESLVMEQCHHGSRWLQGTTREGREAVLTASPIRVPATHLGDLHCSLGSWLQPSPAMAIVGIWGMNQQMEACVSLSLPQKLIYSLKILLALPFSTPEVMQVTAK